MNHKRVAVLFALLALSGVRSAAAAAGPGAVFQSFGGDFSAFYCSGVAFNEHRNPYLVEPLRSCEERVQPSRGHVNGMVDPAPLPGYDLAFFGGLAHVSYGLAKIIWYLSLLGSIAVATFCLTRLTGFPALAVLLLLVPVDGILNLAFGQLPPILVAALCLAAYSIEHKRYVAAAFFGAVTMIEPHIGAPACIAMFLCFPACRVALAALAIFLAALAIESGGIAQNLAYFSTHLPAQARGELVAADQFSLSAILHLLHLPDNVALELGTLSYLAMAAIGIVLGQRAARNLRCESFVILVPAAAALFAGTYVHDVQFAAALPAALLLCAKQRFRLTSWLGLTLLIMPWFTYATGGRMIGIAVRIVAAIAIVWLAVLATEQRPSAVRRAAIGASASLFVALLAIFAILPHSAVQKTSPIPSALISSNASAQENWGAYLRATPSLSRTTLREESEKLPFWIGIIAILISAASASASDSEVQTDVVRRRSRFTGVRKIAQTD